MATSKANDLSKSEYVSIRKASEILGISYQTMWRWVKAGEVPAIRFGRCSYRILRNTVYAMQENNSVIAS
jgi:excisionase family DNA binding protein